MTMLECDMPVQQVSVNVGDLVMIITDNHADDSSLVKKEYVKVNDWMLATILNVEGEPSNRFMVESSNMRIRRKHIVLFKDFDPINYDETLKNIIFIKDKQCFKIMP